MGENVTHTIFSIISSVQNTNESAHFLLHGYIPRNYAHCQIYPQTQMSRKKLSEIRNKLQRIYIKNISNTKNTSTDSRLKIVWNRWKDFSILSEQKKIYQKWTRKYICSCEIMTQINPNLYLIEFPPGLGQTEQLISVYRIRKFFQEEEQYNF